MTFEAVITEMMAIRKEIEAIENSLKHHGLTRKTLNRLDNAKERLSELIDSITH